MSDEAFEFLMVCQVILFGTIIVVGYVAKWLTEWSDHQNDVEDAERETAEAIDRAKRHPVSRV